MTNKTIILSRELVEQAVSGAPVKPDLDDYACRGCGNWMPHGHPEAHEHEEGCPEELAAIKRHWRSQMRAALADQSDYLKSCEAAHNSLAEPVLPAGGEVEVRTIAYAVKDRDAWPELSFTWLKRFDTLQKYDNYQVLELVDREHVTRLQAEVARLDLKVSEYDYTCDAVYKERDALKAGVQFYKSLARGRSEKLVKLTKESLDRIGALQSELTKALELLHRAHAADTAGRHELPYNVSKLMDDIEAFLQANQSAPADKGRPELTVWYGPMPESNGKSNFTAMLMRKGGTFLDGITGGICIARGEYPDRVRYEADCMRYLIGELAEEPDMMAYDPDLHSGYVKPEQTAPVAVVMPERMKWDGLRATACNIRGEGWNACLDEVARLNPTN